MIFATTPFDNLSLQRSEQLKKKTMKRLTCRKCEGHGFISVLKGHAAVCPFNECGCERCSSVMSMRANALIRRFRHRQPGQNLAVLKTIRSKNGNMRLRIVPKGDQVAEGTTITYTDESSARAYVVSSSLTMSASASGSSSPSLPTSPPLLPTNVTTPLLPPLNHDILLEYLQQILQAKLYTELLKQQASPFDLGKPVEPLSPLLANALLSSMQRPLQNFFSFV
ncbi:DM (Doublesex/MAB-3) Domain family [Trichostrongylus colubriformis]|uniref:DM (Doublesex/MAB-3) Domain family n=1 Tax=Trichostrongylus colubriformis TaxID=6319 RepID=A0AAN8FU85_TRICO